MLWRAGEHESLTEAAWDAATVRAAIAAIVADAERAARDASWPGHPLDDVRVEEAFGSLYLGSAGMIWALAELGSAYDGAAAVGVAIERYRGAPDDFDGWVHPSSLWMGETGLLVVASALGAPAFDAGRLAQLVRANRAHPSWELMWGSPGALLAARACGLDDEYGDSAERLCAEWDEASGLWPHELYGRRSAHLGPAHGFAGNVHALRGFLAEDYLSARVTRLLTRTMERAGGLVNWPPVDSPWREVADKIRVQWCHGAPGLIATLGDLMPLELAIGGGELTWRAGPLRKGPGLCHGTAGNGFALLRLYELAGDRVWLERARRFAMHAIEQVDAERSRLGRGRYTLWTGDIGVALYLRACLDGDARVPTIDFW